MRNVALISLYLNTASYIERLRSWINKGRNYKSRQMRELLRDYVLILANTGIRHGTEA
jgi:hypothetical protein